MARTGVLLLNIGTPSSPEVAAVRRYLREFLSDARVIDLPALPRWLLLNLVILPVRPRRSAAAYRKIWTREGSPLLLHGLALARALEHQLGAGRCVVKLAMHYGQPGISEALAQFAELGIDHLVVVPLYPQYSGAATGSGLERVMSASARQWVVPQLQVIPAFYDQPGFLEAQVRLIAPLLEQERPDHVLFSFHGVPERHCSRSDLKGERCLRTERCCDQIVTANRHCYRAQCYETSRLLAQRLALDPQGVSVAFQSRLGQTPWVKPYTDQVIPDLARRGVRRLLVVEPSFVADCLETLEEIGERGRQAFLEAGGEALILAPCLNASPAWVSGLAEILRGQVPALADRS